MLSLAQTVGRPMCLVVLSVHGRTAKFCDWVLGRL